MSRPPLYTVRMTRYAVMLDLDTVTYLRELGGGNLSLGIRLLVARGVSPESFSVGQTPLDVAALAEAAPSGNDAEP